ncbi:MULTISPECIES: flagellar biosynthetic protein FliR [Pseudovibrio]|uniref:flagellar biosynthetic protein FliR n=1 Tax=Stappiaceae TaxID=2821832 RepID=UPI0023664407|nr:MULTISPECIES: flagellar biosynthetic protein FliR [Pseudovibrio]MDD7910451.1 flagellar biosynthetic protein FliR [Pseudovibrio exalbescens]MDX5594166.1 flagellar biosynthetic protein FliR [Pseudovibrio sp. SPO723]
MTVELGFITSYVVTFLLVFARLGSMLMLMPALGEASLPMQSRLGLALALTYILAPIGQPLYPDTVLSSFPTLMVMLISEIIIGLFVGASVRIVTFALQTAGAMIANQMGLAFALGGDLTASGMQGAVIGNFLSILGTVLIFATNLHYLAIAAMHDSFTLFPPGTFIPVGDASANGVALVSQMFSIAVRLSAPFMVLGLTFYFGMGLLNKLMPQLQIFFIAMPVNIMLGLFLMLGVLATMMGWYLTQVETAFQPFIIQ